MNYWNRLLKNNLSLCARIVSARVARVITLPWKRYELKEAGISSGLTAGRTTERKGTMEEEKYFVMLFSQSGESITPLVGQNDEVLLFNTLNNARCAAKENIMGSAFGFEVFMLGNGE